jgi:hypothetical protein
MMKLYGEDATIRAAMLADALLDQGDSERFFAWKRIAKAMADLEQMPSAEVPGN